MKRSTLFAVAFVGGLVLAIGTSIALAQDTIDLLWKARALQAAEKLKKFSQQLDDPAYKLSQKQKFEMMLESAYAAVIAKPDILVKKGPSGTSYHLILNYGADGWLDVRYVYPNGSNGCVSMCIDRLPKNRSIVIPTAPELSISVSGDDPNEPTIVFSRSNPFLTVVRAEGAERL